tara:strand:+ start:169 stop:1311 length:1143 start_codon:yes stop_codon:yes gene_type:complete
MVQSFSCSSDLDSTTIPSGKTLTNSYNIGSRHSIKVNISDVVTQLPISNTYISHYFLISVNSNNNVIGCNNLALLYGSSSDIDEGVQIVYNFVTSQVADYNDYQTIWIYNGTSNNYTLTNNFVRLKTVDGSNIVASIGKTTETTDDNPGFATTPTNLELYVPGPCDTCTNIACTVGMDTGSRTCQAPSPPSCESCDSAVSSGTVYPQSDWSTFSVNLKSSCVYDSVSGECRITYGGATTQCGTDYIAGSGIGIGAVPASQSSCAASSGITECTSLSGSYCYESAYDSLPSPPPPSPPPPISPPISPSPPPPSMPCGISGIDFDGNGVETAGDCLTLYKTYDARDYSSSSCTSYLNSRFGTTIADLEAYLVECMRIIANRI